MLNRYNELCKLADRAAYFGDLQAEWVCELLRSGNYTASELAMAIAERDAWRFEEESCREAARKMYAAWRATA